MIPAVARIDILDMLVVDILPACKLLHALVILVILRSEVHEFRVIFELVENAAGFGGASANIIEEENVCCQEQRTCKIFVHFLD